MEGNHERFYQPMKLTTNTHKSRQNEVTSIYYQIHTFRNLLMGHFRDYVIYGFSKCVVGSMFLIT